jgi:pyridoxal phosphate enzyme (YggS family)
MTTRAEDIARNLEAVRARIASAERAAGRTSGSARLIAVSKTMPAEDVRAALAHGQHDFGENYAQELRDKRAALLAAIADAAARPRWHYIGPIQSNKVKYLAGQVALVHTVDAPALLPELERRTAGAAGAPVQDCLVQVNVAGEAQKRGLSPADLPALLDGFAACPHLRCVGLMLIPPLTEAPEAARPHFQALRRLRDEQASVNRRNVELRELSMGMSHDLEVAVAEGATLVRVGTAIFGERRKDAP